MKSKTKKLSLLTLALCLALESLALAQVDTAWVRRYNGPADVENSGIALADDTSGNVYVTGQGIGSGTDRDYTTIKYAPNGDTAWVRSYNGPGNGWDDAKAIAVDAAGNVYVTGLSWGSGTLMDYATIKYAPNGDTLWVRRYTGQFDDWAYALAIDAAGNVYVTGTSRRIGSTWDYGTIKYAPNGDTLWVRHYDGPKNDADFAYAVAVDNDGNVYVTGAANANNNSSFSDQDYATIKYAPNGDSLWVRLYNYGPVNDADYAWDLAVDSTGNVYATGVSQGSVQDYATIKYAPNGDTLWVRRYNYGADKAYDLAVDSIGNVYVTGWSSSDYATVKYDSNGNTSWVKRYNGPGNWDDHGRSLAVDNTGHVYVTGYSTGSGTSYDYATIKYKPNGDTAWTRRYNGPGNQHDYARALAVDNDHNVYVTGYSWNGTSYDFATIKYLDLCSIGPDADADGVADICDNCPNDINPTQQDTDADGLGDVCDLCPQDPLNDQDNDGICGNLDNCPTDSNPNQENSDSDGLGDACDNCPTVTNSNQQDSDNDGIGDVCDLCPQDPLNDQDNDGICGNLDNCPTDSNPNQEDGDIDGIGDLCDNCPTDPNSNQQDTDNDGIGDECDGCQTTLVIQPSANMSWSQMQALEAMDSEKSTSEPEARSFWPVQSSRVADATGAALPLPIQEIGRTPVVAPDATTAGYPLLVSFQSLGDNNGQTIIPDTHGAVGPNHVVTMHNSGVMIHDRNGASQGNVSLLTFWGVFDGFNPRIVYDQGSGRWLACVAARPNTPYSNFRFAISSTSDPTGNWTFYTIDADPTNTFYATFLDMGFNSTWIAITADMWIINGTCYRAGMWIIDKSTALDSGPITVNMCPAGFTDDEGVYGWTMRVCQTFGSEPKLYLIDYNRFTLNGFYALSLSEITGTGSAPVWLPTPGSLNPNTGMFSVPYEFSNSDLYPASQAGTSLKVETNWTYMANAVFRNGKIWCTHTGGVPLPTPERTAVFWYQVDPTLMPNPIVQSGVLDGGTGVSHYYPSITANASDDAMIGFSRSDSSKFVEAVYTSRYSTDPLSTMDTIRVLKLGEERYDRLSGGKVRWGQFSSTVVDPINDQWMWTIQEYAESGIHWGTWWGMIGDCSVIPDADTDGVSDLCDNCPADTNFSQLDSDLDGFGDVCDNCPSDSNPDQFDSDSDGIGNICDPCNFFCGDVNNSGAITIPDVGQLFNYVFNKPGGPWLNSCGISEADIDSFQNANIRDAAWLSRYIFGSGASPSCPYAHPEYQPTLEPADTISRLSPFVLPASSSSLSIPIRWRNTSTLAGLALPLKISVAGQVPIIETVILGTRAATASLSARTVDTTQGTINLGLLWTSGLLAGADTLITISISIVADTVSRLVQIDTLQLIPANHPLFVRYQSLIGTIPTFAGFGPISCLAKPGNVNGDAQELIGLPDVIHLVNYVFDKDRPATSCLGSDPGNCWTPDPLCRGEVNGTSPIGLPDVIHLVNYVFDKDRPATSCLGSSPGNCWTPVLSDVCCLPVQ